jgi:hypothetical protein
MNRSIRIIICCNLLLAALAAAQQPSTRSNDAANSVTPPQGTAKCVLYRHRLARGSAVRIGLFIDGVQAANIVNGRWVSLDVPAGHHTIKPKDDQSGLEMELEAGKTYYVLTWWGEEGMFHAAHKMVTLVAPEQGAYEVKQLKPLDEKDVSWPGAGSANAGGDHKPKQ